MVFRPAKAVLYALTVLHDERGCVRQSIAHRPRGLLRQRKRHANETLDRR
jgi:hypothetical protein